MAWVSLRTKPLGYHWAKLRAGYLFIEGPDGGDVALAPRQRRLIGAVNRLANLFAYLRRAALAGRARRLAPGFPRLDDGYARVPAVPGHAAAIAICERQLEIYFDYLRRGPRALRKRGIDRFAYEREIAKTAGDPLKHVPVHYDAEAVAGLLAFGLQPALVAAAADHIGLLPVLSGLRILYSPNAPAEKFASAQLFHLDPEGARQAKVFMAVRPVGPANSPLTFLPISLTRRLLFAGGDPYRTNRVQDKLIFRMLRPRHCIEHLGEPGDAVIVDTSQCFHFGSRPNSAPRVLLYFSFHDPFASSAPIRYPAAKAAQAWRAYTGRPHPFTDFLLSRRL